MLKLLAPLIALVCAPFFTGSTAYGQNHPDHPPLVTGPGGQIGIHGPNGRFIGIDDDPEAVLGGTLSNPFASFAPPNLIGFDSAGLIVEYKINKVKGSQWSEFFLVGMPRGTKLSSPLPVLVLFHGYGKHHFGPLVATDYFSLAMQRGWIVVAPLGAHGKNYGIEYSQKNVEAALDLLVGSIAPSFGASVDLDRFYAVGFSMGGGAAMSFAARHLDGSDNGLRFAGVVNHTGTTSLSHSYWANPNVASVFNQNYMFGGSPNAKPFRYPRVSSIDLEYPSPNDVGLDNDMVRNLVPVPVLHYTCKTDPLTYVVMQTERTHEHLENTLGGKNSTLWTGDKLPGNNHHDWQNLPEQDVLDWLAPKSYQAPADDTWVSTLADRDGRWHGFEITQVTQKVFSPFKWRVKALPNLIQILEVDNIEELKIPSPTSVGLDPSSELMVSPDTTLMPSNNMNVVLGEYLSKPSSVTISTIAGETTAVEGTDWFYSTPEVTLVIPGGRDNSVWKVKI